MEMTFDDLSPAQQQLVRDSKTVYDFFMKSIAPRLEASTEEMQSFVDTPTRYLIAAGCPVISDLSAERRDSMDARLAGPLPVAQNVGCWICTKAIEVAITIVAVVGVIIVAAILTALATALGAASGLAIAIILILIGEVGVVIGAELLGAHVEALAKAVCREMRIC